MYQIRRTGILFCFSLPYLAAPSIAHCGSGFLLFCEVDIVALSHMTQMCLQECKLFPSSNFMETLFLHTVKKSATEVGN